MSNFNSDTPQQPYDTTPSSPDAGGQQSFGQQPNPEPQTTQPESAQYGQQAGPEPVYGQPAYTQPQYQQPQYAQPQYQQPPQYAQPPYGQQQPYTGNQYAQQPPMGQPYGQVPYGYEPRQKIVAGLLGIFLGAFGVHNFYLGYTGKAVAQLLLTVLTIGILSWVSAIWGLIEAILILTSNYGSPWHRDAKGVELRD